MKAILIAISVSVFVFLLLVKGVAGPAHQVPWDRQAGKHGLKGTTILKAPSQEVIQICFRDIAAEGLPKMRVWGTFQDQNFWIYVFSKSGVEDAPLLMYFQSKKTKTLEKKFWTRFDLN